MTKRAFSLVELSIVLVILGLLVGGVLSGQSLIRAAELRSVSTEYSQHTTAFHTFRDKYFALAGDMPNATLFWGAADAGDGLGSDCTDVVSTTATTCNGNGDGRVANNNTESFRYWQHMANAGLIEGAYTGVTTGAAGTWTVTAGVNAPRSKLGKAAWSMRYAGSLAGSVSTWEKTSFPHILGFGTAGGYYTLGSALTPQEAWNIDTKMDDGKPGLGKALVYRVDLCSDTTDGNNTGANYLLTSDTVNCALFITPDL